MSALPALIEKLSALQGPSREVDAEISKALLNYADSMPDGPAGWRKVPEYTGSLDAAIALTERVLPGSNRTIRKRYRTTSGRIDGHKYDAQVSGGDVCEGFNEATALCLATLRALEAKETGR